MNRILWIFGSLLLASSLMSSEAYAEPRQARNCVLKLMDSLRAFFTDREMPTQERSRAAIAMAEEALKSNDLAGLYQAIHFYHQALYLDPHQPEAWERGGDLLVRLFHDSPKHSSFAIRRAIDFYQNAAFYLSERDPESPRIAVMDRKMIRAEEMDGNQIFVFEFLSLSPVPILDAALLSPPTSKPDEAAGPPPPSFKDSLLERFQKLSTPQSRENFVTDTENALDRLKISIQELGLASESRLLYLISQSQMPEEAKEQALIRPRSFVFEKMILDYSRLLLRLELMAEHGITKESLRLYARVIEIALLLPSKSQSQDSSLEAPGQLQVLEYSDSSSEALVGPIALQRWHESLSLKSTQFQEESVYAWIRRTLQSSADRSWSELYTISFLIGLDSWRLHQATPFEQGDLDSWAQKWREISWMTYQSFLESKQDQIPASTAMAFERMAFSAQQRH